MTLTLRRLPLLLLLPLLAAALAAVLLARRSEAPSLAHATPRPAAAIPFEDAAPASLTTAQLVARYRAELSAAPGEERAYVNLALAELQMAREDGDPSWYPRAEALLDRARRLDASDALVPAALGSLAATRHRFAEALRLGRVALALDPASSYALGVVVDAQVELGRYAGARRSLERMLDTRPGLSSYSRASYLLELQGRTAAARRALEAAVSAGPARGENTAWARLYLGNLAFNHGDLGAARRQYALALRTDPGFVHALAAQGRLAAATGHLPAAIRLYGRAVARYPLPAYVAALGDADAAAGRAAEARRQYALVGAEERLYAAAGVNVDVELALFDADHGRPVADDVARLSRLARTQRSVTVSDALAWTLFAAGRPRAALAASDRALRLGTRDASFLYHRGAIEAALGMRAAARRDLGRALSQNPHFSLLHERDARRLLARVSR